MTLQASVSISWINTVLAAAQQQGVEREHLLTQAGIPFSALDAERWPVDDITRLWRAAERCTQDQSFGLKVGSSVGPASFNVVSFLLQAAPTLRSAFALGQEYQSLISDGGRFQMIAGVDSCWVVYHPNQGELVFSPHQIESVLTGLVVFSSWVTGSSLQPLAVQFSQAQLGPLTGYREVFRCSVTFEQAFSGVLFTNESLDAPLPQADAQLMQVLYTHARERLTELALQTELDQALRVWIARQLQTHLPTRAQAAQALGLTQRTMVRRLQAKGLSFSGLLDDARRDAALLALAQTRRSVTEIGLALGYAEGSVFNRAVRRWTGISPRAWRLKKQAVSGL